MIRQAERKHKFYNLPDHIIRRVDCNQYFKDKCDYCGQRYGYDYLVYEKCTI